MDTLTGKACWVLALAKFKLGDTYKLGRFRLGFARLGLVWLGPDKLGNARLCLVKLV